METENKDLIWVDAKLAKKYKTITSDSRKDEMVIKFIEDSKIEYLSYIENLEDDVLQFKGSMIKMKKAFKEAKESQIDDMYKLWEKFDEETPRIDKKVDSVLKKLSPISECLQDISSSLSKISLHNIDRLLDIIGRIEGMSKKNVSLLLAILESNDTEK